MASSAKHFCFLLCILLASSTLIQARESKFFSKFNQYQKTDPANSTPTISNNNNNNNSELNQEQVPAVKQEEEKTSNGYGLYGHDSNQFSPSTTTENSQEYTHTNDPSKISTEEYTGGSYENNQVNTNGNYYNNNKQYGMSDTRFVNNPNVNNNNVYNTKQYGMSDTRFTNNPNVNNNNGYNTKQYDTSDASFLENNNNGYRTQQFDQSGARLTDNGNVNSNNAYETKQYGTRFAENENNNKYYGNEGSSKVKQQGLSDTRFLENGKYFHNVNNENSYLNNYQPVNERYDGYNPSQVVTSRNNYNYGNDQKEYEFNKGESQYQGDDSQDVFSP